MQGLRSCRRSCEECRDHLHLWKVYAQLQVFAVQQMYELFYTQCHMQGSTITVFGPDVLTSCGNPGRRLSINQTYLIGLGGPCSPIAEWSSLESFSMDELCLLRDLRADETHLCGTPSSTTTTMMMTQPTPAADTSSTATTMMMSRPTVATDTVTLPVGNSGKLASVPSLLSLTLSVLFILMVAV